jgi:ATP-dependent Lon protease
LPIGGLKEKLLAAHRGNIKTVIIPKDNEKDLAEVPANVIKALKIIPAEHMDEVLAVAFVPEDKIGKEIAVEIQKEETSSLPPVSTGWAPMNA